ncbi:UDP binding domain-containing protein [Streptomyces sp. NPDC006743]|uniref:UDP binding domain-containing protein n=1 Tax=Streptomyces sp. NPDC006743 TaxID=3154480 RepID=UPI0034548C29
MPDVLLVGDWHLASVTAAGLLRLGYAVHVRPDALDAAADEAFDTFARGERCAGEPEVAQSLTAAHGAGALRPVLNEERTAEVLRKAVLTLVAHDTATAVDGTLTDPRPPTALRELLAHPDRGGPVVALSQLRAGTCDAALSDTGLPADSADLVHLPENLRLGRALSDFLRPARTVVGCNAPELPGPVSELLDLIASVNELRMTLAEAELVKHGTNAYLALCITLANDLGTIAGSLGADPVTVLDGLRADDRVADRAPLRPGEAYAGATLHRDVRALMEQGRPIGRDGLFRAIAHSNAVHALAPLARLDRELEGVGGRTVCLLGLTYKPGVSTLRDSPALRLGRELTTQGASVTAYDPIAEQVDLGEIHRATTLAEAVAAAHCTVLMVEHPAFTEPDLFKGVQPRRPLLMRLTGTERRTRVPTPPGWRSVDPWSG